MHQLNNLDVILVLLTLLSMAISLIRGLTKEVLSIIGWILAAGFVFYLLPYLTPFIQNYVKGSMMASFVSSLVLLVVFYILWFLATFKMLKKLRKSKLSSLDRGLGLIFGFLRAFLLVVLFNILFKTMLPDEAKNPFFADSHYFSVAGDFAEPLQKLVPEETLKKIKEKSFPSKQEKEDNSEELFKKLVEPQTATIKAKPESEEEGYDKKETQDLDRLIENTAE